MRSLPLMPNAELEGASAGSGGIGRVQLQAALPWRGTAEHDEERRLDVTILRPCYQLLGVTPRLQNKSPHQTFVTSIRPLDCYSQASATQKKFEIFSSRSNIEVGMKFKNKTECTTQN